jgi:hypothetical protein
MRNTAITSKYDVIIAANHFVGGSGAALSPARLGPQKIPKNESENGQDDDQDRPEHFLSGIRTALENIDDGPDIGD